MSSLLHSCETWVVYRRHLKILERFHQRCLRSVLEIQWKSHTPDIVARQRAISLCGSNSTQA